MATAREMMERAISTWNARDKSAWISLFGPDFDLSLPGGLQADGIAAAQLFYALWQDAFPDNRVEPQRIITEGDTVVLESIFDGTHTGPLNLPTGSVPPTNKHARVPYVLVGTAGADTFARMVFYYDQVEILEQLGLMPAPAPA